MLTALALDLAVKHWRKLAVLVALALAFILGRASVPDVPARVEVREVVKRKERERFAAETITASATERTEAKRQTVIVYRDRVVTPDGTRHEREIETTATEAQAHEVAKAESVRVEVREVVREVQVDKLVQVEAARPQWRVGGLVGIDVPGSQLYPLALGPPAFGAIVERRIIGPVSAGVWGLHTGTGGVVLSVEF